MTRLTVTSPADPWELQAEAVAAQVLRGLTPHDPGPAMWHAHRQGAGQSAGRGAQQDAKRGAGGRQLPDEVLVACAGTGGGRALSDAVRARLEPVIGIDLSAVRVRQDQIAAAAAQALGARAFTSGSTIYLAAQSSPSDVALMAHEATHVAQQAHAPAARSRLMRSVSDYLPEVSVSDVVPDWILDGVRSTVRAMPGYTALSYVVGQDLLTGKAVSFDPAELIDAVLTYGPFGPAVSAALTGLNVVSEVVAAVRAQFGAHNLTFARISRDLTAAWKEVSVTNGIEGNAAILRRYLDAFLRDLRALVESLVDRVLELARAAVVAVAEPLLATPQIAPVWNLAKEVLHYDPLRGVPVQVPTAQIIADFLVLIGQEQRLAQMRERGTLQQTADWLDLQLLTFAGLVVDLVTLFADAWAAIQPQSLPNLLDTLPALADRAFGLVQRVGNFAATLIVQILTLVKDALLGWLSENAHKVTGFHLLTVIIGQNPFTGEVVPRTASNLIKGFITLLPNGEATYEQLEKSGVIGDAAGQIESAMARLGISLEMVTGLFLGIWNAVSLDDLLNPLPAFGRVIDQFGAPLLRLIEFVAVVVKVVITLILRLMNFPTELLGHVITNTVQAITDIKRDPVAFLLHIVEAMKLGFLGFFDHFAGYLLDGLVAWLFRGLGQIGITIPTDFSLKSILGLVLQVLGLTVEHLWAKLGEHLGEEKVALIRKSIDTLTGVWSFILEVQRDGIGAIWKFLSDQLSSLWQTLLGMATDWIVKTVVAKATVELLSFLDPTGIMAVVNSCVAIFNAIQSAIDYIRDLLQVLDTYVSTIAAIAAGNVAPGALMLERGLAGILPIAIGFLANQVGLGNVPEEIVRIIGGLREMVDKAIDWLIDQALRLGQAVLDALGLSKKEEKKVEPTDHAAVADHVIAELEKPGTSVEYAALRAEEERKAHGFENQYTGQLGEGIGLNVVFQPAAGDAADDAIDFEVVIAPNTTKKKGTLPTRHTATISGATLTIGAKNFNVGDDVQFAKGGKPRQKFGKIVGIRERDVSGTGKQPWVDLESEPPGEQSSFMAATSFGNDWIEIIPATKPLSMAELARLNAFPENQAWPEDDYRKVLNYRYYGVQIPNPAGMEWEHIIEQKSLPIHSAENLALTTETVNGDLNTYYANYRTYTKLAVENDITEPVQLRAYLKGKPAAVQRWWKLWVYASADFGLTLQWHTSTQPLGGRYQTLS